MDETLHVRQYLIHNKSYACTVLYLSPLMQIGIVDLDICGPSVPKLLGVQGQSVVNSQYGWVPIRYARVYTRLVCELIDICVVVVPSFFCCSADLN